MWPRVVLFSVLALAMGCAGRASPHPDTAGSGGESNTGGDAAGGLAATPETWVEVGTPSDADDLEFAPLADGDELRVQTFGQGGTHVLVGMRCSGFGSRAFVSAQLENLSSGVVVEEPAPARPQLLYCEDTGTCDLVPYLVHVSGLTKTDEEKDGLHVRLTIRVDNEAGASGECSREVVLSTTDL